MSASFATRHTKAIYFILAALCLAGLGTLGSFPVSILPNMSFPRLVIIGEAGKRPAEMVVVDVTRPIEQAVATVRGVTKIRSKTQRGATEISVDFAWGTNMITALQMVNQRISEVRPQLPPDADISTEQMNPTLFPILGLSFQADNLSQTQLWDLATYTIKPRLTRVPGVAQVVVQGGQPPEVAVDVDPPRLMAYGLSLADVEQAVSQRNDIAGVGRLNHQYQQYQIVVSGKVSTAAELADTVVAQRGGVPIYLRQVAHVYPSVAPRNTIVTADGKEAVLVNIIRQPNANTIAVARGVRRELAAMMPSLPHGLHVGTFYDQSDLVSEAVGSVRDAVLIGAVFAVIVLFGFLGDWRATAMTVLILPATMLVTFFVMRLVGLTLNLMTLGAQAIAIGLVIDTAIVVVENIVRRLAAGGTRLGIVEAATAEISAPLISSTLTTVVVFLPLVLLHGITGVFFTGMAIALSISLLASLAMALLASPGLCTSVLRVKSGPEHGPLLASVIRGYEAVLRLSLRRRALFLVGIPVILLATGFIGHKLGSGFMPSMDEGSFVLDYYTPPGTSLAESNRILTKIETILHHTPEVTTFSRRTGTELGFAITEPNTGDFTVVLKRRRKKTIDQVMDEVRSKIEQQIPGVDVEFVQVLQDLIGDLAGAPQPIQIKLFGNNQAQLKDLSDHLAGELGKIRGTVDVATSVVESGPEFVVRVDPSRAGRAGMTAESIAAQANTALFGDIATRILQGDKLVRVRVRYAKPWRSTRRLLEQLPLRMPGGYTLPLGDLGTIETVPGTTEINREDQRRVAIVSARLSGRDLGSTMKDIQKMMLTQMLPRGVTYSFGGQYASQKKSFSSMMVVLLLAIALVFGVMLFQFRAFAAPLVIMLVMPLSLFGVAFGLWVTGTPLNVSSFMGAIMLVGLVVKNGILLLDQADRSREEGLSLEEAVVRAGRVRLRPILMTTLAAILALVPLALGIGAGAEMQKPLAIAVIGGLTFSTVFTLVFAPLTYVSIRRWRLRGRTG